MFVRDLATGTTTLASPNAAGSDSAEAASVRPAINAAGTKVVYTSLAGDLGPTDTTTCTPPQTGITRPCIDV